MTIGIYCIRNIANGKHYVGQSVNIERRWAAHRARMVTARANSRPVNAHLYAAWGKYGAASFEFLILEACDVDSLDARETYWIAAMRACEHGYNKAPVGGSGRGKRLSKEHRAHISAGLRGRPKTPEHAAAAGRGQLGKKRRPLSDGHKALQSASLRRALASYVVRGEAVSLHELKRRYGLNPSTLWRWMRRHHMTAEQALEYGLARRRAATGSVA